MLISNVCLADSQWLIMHDDSNLSMSLDTTRISTYNDEEGSYLDCWIQTNVKEKNITLFHRRYINVKNFNYKDVEKLSYRDNKFVGKGEPDKEWISPKSGSKNEETIQNIVFWSVNNKDKVTVKKPN